MSVLSCLIDKVTSTDVRIINILQRLPHKMAENSWYEEITSLSPYVYNKSTHSPIKRNILWHKINTKKLKSGLVASYDIRPGNREGLFWFWQFINLSLTYLVRDLSTLQPQDPHGGPLSHLIFSWFTDQYEGSTVAPFTMVFQCQYPPQTQNLQGYLQWALLQAGCRYSCHLTRSMH